MKNIVLCSDGTGNRDVKARGSNVFKLYEAIDIHGHKNDASIRQVAYYEDGLGTSPILPVKIIGSTFGFGFSGGVKRLYEALIHAYDPDDKVFLFGFSRGGYTVRALSGLIDCHGIVPRSRRPELLEEEINTGWRNFMLNQRSKDNKIKPIHPTPQFLFVGVWDTVGAIGIPLIDKWGKLLHKLFLYYPWFKDCKPAKCVTHARHALAIDDWRRTFHPVMWDEKDSKERDIKQVWFAGAHSNVGGGYPKQGMSLVALDWMMAEAEAVNIGLRFNESDRAFVKARYDVHSKLYDSRSGMANFFRWEPRDVWRLCKENGVEKPQIHESVLERISLDTDGYAPLNLPKKYIVTRNLDDKSNPSIFGPLHPEITNDNHHSFLDLKETKSRLSNGHRCYWTFVFFSSAFVLFLFLSLFWSWFAGWAGISFILAVGANIVMKLIAHQALKKIRWEKWYETRRNLRKTLFPLE